MEDSTGDFTGTSPLGASNEHSICSFEDIGRSMENSHLSISDDDFLPPSGDGRALGKASTAVGDNRDNRQTAPAVSTKARPERPTMQTITTAASVTLTTLQSIAVECRQVGGSLVQKMEEQRSGVGLVILLFAVLFWNCLNTYLILTMRAQHSMALHAIHAQHERELPKIFDRYPRPIASYIQYHSPQLQNIRDVIEQTAFDATTWVDKRLRRTAKLNSFATVESGSCTDNDNGESAAA